MPIEIDDALLEESPYGNFLLAVAEAIDSLNITPLDAIRIDGYGIEPEGDRREIVILPGTEEPSLNFQAGRLNLRLPARVIEIEGNDPAKRQTVGWRVLQRYRMLQRLGGQTQQGATLSRGGHCFQLQEPDYGPLYDDASRQRNQVRSEFTVWADWHGT